MKSAHDGNALDLLEHEDLLLRAMLHEVIDSSGSSVEERARYGDLARSVIRRVFIRESALADVAETAADLPDLHNVSVKFEQNATLRRPTLSRVEKMSKGMQTMDLNTEQDFDAELSDLIWIVGNEIDWDLREAIPEVRHALVRAGRMGELQKAKTLRKRASTNLHPDRARWWERAAVVSRLVTVYDELRDFGTRSRI